MRRGKIEGRYQLPKYNVDPRSAVWKRASRSNPHRTFDFDAGNAINSNGLAIIKGRCYSKFKIATVLSGTEIPR